jgi:hypothetical protein
LFTNLFSLIVNHLNHVHIIRHNYLSLTQIFNVGLKNHPLYYVLNLIDTFIVIFVELKYRFLTYLFNLIKIVFKIKFIALVRKNAGM